MGKARKVKCIKDSEGTLNCVDPKPPSDEPCRPIVKAPVACSSCEAETLVNGFSVPTLPPGSDRKILSIKFWTKMDLECAVCNQREAVRTFECTLNVPVAKAFGILANCELECASRIDQWGATLRSFSYYESAELLVRVSSHITKLYRRMQEKRPKQLVAAMSQDLRDLDFDAAIDGKDMVCFRCSDGDLKITCNRVMLLIGTGSERGSKSHCNNR